MELKIDALGRILLPKRLRERFGLQPETFVEVKESNEGILISQKEERPRLRKMSNGLLIFTGGGSDDFDVVAEIRKTYEEREARILRKDG